MPHFEVAPVVLPAGGLLPPIRLSGMRHALTTRTPFPCPAATNVQQTPALLRNDVQHSSSCGSARPSPKSWPHADLRPAARCNTAMLVVRPSATFEKVRFAAAHHATYAQHKQELPFATLFLPSAFFATNGKRRRLVGTTTVRRRLEVTATVRRRCSTAASDGPSRLCRRRAARDRRRRDRCRLESRPPCRRRVSRFAPWRWTAG